jgi:hypothetical protein
MVMFVVPGTAVSVATARLRAASHVSRTGLWLQAGLSAPYICIHLTVQRVIQNICCGPLLKPLDVLFHDNPQIVMIPNTYYKQRSPSPQYHHHHPNRLQRFNLRLRPSIVEYISAAKGLAGRQPFNSSHHTASQPIVSTQFS